MVSTIVGLYSSLPLVEECAGLPHIEPYIGVDFATPSPTRLRVLGVGINSYVSDDDVPGADPGWFRGWVEHGRQPFFQTLRRECETLARGVLELGAEVEPWSSMSFESPAGLYGTNAVKRLLPSSVGRHAAEVESKWFDEGSDVWRRELGLLAQHGALPHLIVVFGERAWWPTCSVMLSLCDHAAEPAFVRYEAMSDTSEVFHRLNVVHVMDRGQVRPCMVARLNHSAAFGSDWNAAETLSVDEFRQAISG